MSNSFPLYDDLFTEAIEKISPSFFAYKAYLGRFLNGILKCIPRMINKIFIPGKHKVDEIMIYISNFIIPDFCQCTVVTAYQIIVKHAEGSRSFIR